MKALKAAPRRWDRWRELSFTHQREHAEAVEGAKKPETRDASHRQSRGDGARDEAEEEDVEGGLQTALNRMTGAPIFFDLDDTLLDDTGAQDAYLAELYVAWRTDLPHDEAAFCEAWRAALDRHFERHLRGELTFLEQRRERIREVFQAPGLSDVETNRRTG